jgi:hypothetical protein
MVHTWVLASQSLLGMSKLMVSAAEVALAAVIASRKVHSLASQVPSPGSLVELTMKVVPAA